MIIVPVVSGKGGVGKSTVAVNLAIALAANGARVALIDADFYGPSIPTMLGGGSLAVDHEERLIPPAKFGVKYISIGFFLNNPDDPVIWRGPMINKALNQLFNDVSWGEVDYCIVDMPPGTGDAQISLCQMVQLAGAVVVTTPQEVSLADVRKSVNMLSKVNVPVLGVVENMAGFMLPDGSIQHVFGQGGGKALADKIGAPLLASIALDSQICAGGDAGEPVASRNGHPLAKQFSDLALQLMEILAKSQSANAGVKIIN